MLPVHVAVEADIINRRYSDYDTFLASIGLGFAYNHGFALLTILITAGSWLAYQIGIEEEILSSQLGNNYVQYMKRTKRFIPLIW